MLVDCRSLEELVVMVKLLVRPFVHCSQHRQVRAKIQFKETGRTVGSGTYTHIVNVTLLRRLLFVLGDVLMTAAVT